MTTEPNDTLSRAVTALSDLTEARGALAADVAAFGGEGRLLRDASDMDALQAYDLVTGFGVQPSELEAAIVNRTSERRLYLSPAASALADAVVFESALRAGHICRHGFPKTGVCRTCRREAHEAEQLRVAQDGGLLTVEAKGQNFVISRAGVEVRRITGREADLFEEHLTGWCPPQRLFSTDGRKVARHDACMSWLEAKGVL